MEPGIILSQLILATEKIGAAMPPGVLIISSSDDGSDVDIYWRGKDGTRHEIDYDNSLCSGGYK